jgi:hypothetical protein
MDQPTSKETWKSEMEGMVSLFVDPLGSSIHHGTDGLTRRGSRILFVSENQFKNLEPTQSFPSSGVDSVV